MRSKLFYNWTELKFTDVVFKFFLSSIFSTNTAPWDNPYVHFYQFYLCRLTCKRGKKCNHKNFIRNLFNVQERYLECEQCHNYYESFSILRVQTHKKLGFYLRCAVYVVWQQWVIIFYGICSVYIEISIQCECFFVWIADDTYKFLGTYLYLFTAITMFQRLQS